MSIDFEEKDGMVTFGVRVVPGASKSEIPGGHDGDLRVRISAPPVDGAANAELIKLLAKKFGVVRSDIQLLGGLASKAKRIRISGVTAARLLNLSGG